jgi:hypothetical protein
MLPMAGLVTVRLLRSWVAQRAESQALLESSVDKVRRRTRGGGGAFNCALSLALVPS